MAKAKTKAKNPKPITLTISAEDIAAAHHEREDALLASMLSMGSDPFAAGMMISALLDLECEIIRLEVYDAYYTKGTRIAIDLNERRQHYTQQRHRVKEALGRQFSGVYASLKHDHNECERENLKGKLYAYVLPEFHDDGSHEPWSASDVPPREQINR